MKALGDDTYALTLVSTPLIKWRLPITIIGGVFALLDIDDLPFMESYEEEQIVGWVKILRMTILPDNHIESLEIRVFMVDGMDEAFLNDLRSGHLIIKPITTVISNMLAHNVKSKTVIDIHHFVMIPNILEI